jgi:hypothetical protein
MKGGCLWGAGVFLALLAVGLGLIGLHPSIWEAAFRFGAQQQGFHVEKIQVQKLGLAELEFGQSKLAGKMGNISWRDVQVDYRLPEVLRGRIRSIEVDGLELELTRRTESAPSTKPPDPPSAQDLGPLSETPASDAQGIPLEQDIRKSLVNHFNPVAHLKALPFARLQVSDALLRAPGASDLSIELPFSGEINNTDGVLDSAITIGDQLLRTVIHMDPVEAADGYQLFASNRLDVGQSFDLMRAWLSDSAFWMESFTVEAPDLAEFELYAEGDATDGLRWSLTGNIYEAILSFGKFASVHVEPFTMAGTGSPDRLSLHTGIGIKAFQYKTLSIEPFQLRAVLEDDGLRMKSTLLKFRHGSIAGEAAMRGTIKDFSSDNREGFIELSFQNLKTSGLAATPFSLFAEFTAQAVGWTLSPFELNGAGRLGIHDINGRWESDLESGWLCFEVSGSDAAPLGAVRLEWGNQNDTSYSGEILQNDGAGFLRAHGMRNLDGGVHSLTGAIPSKWINECLQWMAASQWKLASEEPVTLQMDLDMRGALPTGLGQINGENLSISSPIGVSCESLGLNLNFRIKGLPSTEGIQRLTIGSLRLGEFVLEDVQGQFAIPTLDRFILTDFQADFNGGRMRLEPFTTSLQDPAFGTVLIAEDIPVQSFLEILEETRFRMEGTVTGQIAIGWEKDQLLLGEGQFSLDDEVGGKTARFVFRDPDFLAQTFASLGGIPDEAKKRLYAALLEEGITLEKLDVSVLPMRYSGEIGIRLHLSGHCANEAIEVPIRGLVIDQRMRAEDLTKILGFGKNASFGIAIFPK